MVHPDSSAASSSSPLLSGYQGFFPGEGDKSRSSKAPCTTRSICSCCCGSTGRTKSNKAEALTLTYLSTTTQQLQVEDSKDGV